MEEDFINEPVLLLGVERGRGGMVMGREEKVMGGGR